VRLLSEIAQPREQLTEAEHDAWSSPLRDLGDHSLPVDAGRERQEEVVRSDKPGAIMRKAETSLVLIPSTWR